MKEAGKNKGVILLDRNRLFFFVEGQKEPIGLEFNSQIFQHFEIINNSEFRRQIDQFIKQNELPTSHIYILLSQSLLFQSDFDLKKEGIDEEKKHYLDVVPFENVGSITLSSNNAERIIAANHDHYSIVREVFEANGFAVEAVTPSQVLGDSFAQAQNLDLSLIKAVFGSETLLKKNNFLAFQHFSVDRENTLPQEPQKKISFFEAHRLVILLTIFVVLLFFLTAIIYFSFFHNQDEVDVLQEEKTQNTISQPTPIPTTDPSFSNESAETEDVIKEDISIQILNGSGIAGEADSLRSLLEKHGFVEISIGDTDSFSSRTQVVYHPRVPTSFRTIIEEELIDIYEDISTSENSTSSSDVVITTFAREGGE